MVQKLLAVSVLRKKAKKTKAVCGLGRTNYGGLRNVRPPIIDALYFEKINIHVLLVTGIPVLM